VDGVFREKVVEGTPDAVKREYEYNGQNLVKWEVLHKNLNGHIIGLTFVDGDFGEQLVITVENEGDLAKLNLPVKGRYFSDFAKKLGGVDLSKPVSLSPYSFETEEGKQLTGITIYHEGGKMTSFYWDGKNTLHGAPEAEKNATTKEDWEIFFAKERKFLKEQIIKKSSLFAEIPKKVERSSLFDSAPNIDENIYRGGVDPYGGEEEGLSMGMPNI
jgi:hypothetical protein